MQRRRLLNEYSAEELAAVANDESQEIIVNKGDRESSMLTFISDYQLKPGLERIKMRRLYDLYKTTTKGHLKYLQFLNDIKKYFDTERRGNNNYVFINRTNINLSKEVHRQLLETQRATPKSRRNDGYFQQQFDEFIKMLNLEPGREYVKRSAIFYYYDMWTFNKRKRRMNYSTFYRLLDKTGLVIQHAQKYMCVKINKEVFTPYEKSIEEAEAWTDKRYLGNRKTNKKIQS